MPRIVTPVLNDLPRLAQCHRLAFPNALSSAMGERYVEKMLEWYLLDERAFIFLLEEDNRCVGYCGGLKFDGTSRVGSASSMIQHSYWAAVKTMLSRPWLFAHREFLPKYGLAWRNVKRRIRRKIGIEESAQRQPEQLPEPHAGLIVIGVDPAMQGRGYGSMMLREFEKISIQLGFKRMMLTVRTGNLKAIRSYQRNEWITTRVEGSSTTMEKMLI